MDTGSSSRKCDWKFELCTTTLLATRGRDFPVFDLKDRLRCPRCGSRSISVMPVIPGAPNRKSASRR
ncbi:hypothetical protein ELG63_36605 [Rhizobium leguminosarum]|nr:hypothetical protein ELI14_04150 [Rhizobium leguminosarum]TBH28219.1 hypothetical protein ELG63_36605 [Rhizobium leguminosarum]